MTQFFSREKQEAKVSQRDLAVTMTRIAEICENIKNLQEKFPNDANVDALQVIEKLRANVVNIVPPAELSPPKNSAGLPNRS